MKARNRCRRRRYAGGKLRARGLAEGQGLQLLVLLVLVTGFSQLGCSRGEPAMLSQVDAIRASAAPAEREWRSYLGDAAVSHFSPLESIHAGNVDQLEVAWSYESGDASPNTASQIQFNPLVVKGVLYGVSPKLRYFALDAATGEELWSFDPKQAVELWSTSRGAVYWESGSEERLIVGSGPYLYALDARTGRVISSFGVGGKGRIDLREGLGRDVSGDMMGVATTTPGSVFEDLLIVGGRVNEARGAAPGHIRAFDIRTGEQRWIFHTIPYPGEFGAETWPADAAERIGGANSWAGFSVDAERGLVFAPTGSATFDFFGGDRPGDNLFANSLIALDARTGERRWHYQFVRHDIWDRDLPSPPNLIEIERDGVQVPAVAQVTKTGHTFVFHRETGEPLFPIREEAVLGEAVRGEVSAATQPLPTAPPPFTRQGFTFDDITRRTPAAYEEVKTRVERMHYGDASFLPPRPEGSLLYPGIDGGAEWGGAAWDAESGLLYVNANQVPAILQLIEAPAELNFLRSPAGGYVMLCSGCHGLDMKGDGAKIPSLVDISDRMGLIDLYRVIRDGRGRMPGFEGYTAWYGLAAVGWWVSSVDDEDRPSNWANAEGPTEFVNAGYQFLVDGEGFPGSKPPWGTLTAIDVAAGELRWQIPLGDYPDLLASGQSGYGAENYGGPVVTAGGLVFIAATPDAMIRAFDKDSGELLWQDELPNAGFATPAVYEARGRQFVVVAAGGGKLRQRSGSSYVAYALPRD